MTITIVLTAVLVVIVCICIALCFKRKQQLISLAGGALEKFTANVGVCSTCYIDRENMKFIKNYVEIKDDKFFQYKRKEVIKNKIVSSKSLREKDMMIYMYNNVPEAKTPKVYVDESYKLPFDEQMWNNIRMSKKVKPEVCTLNKLTLEYLPYPTLQQWFQDNGFICTEDGCNVVENKLSKETLINVYTLVFKLLIAVLQHHILPYDFENTSNILIDTEHNALDLIDCCAYNIIEELDPSITVDDLLVFYIYEFIMLQRKMAVRQLLGPLISHGDSIEILTTALNGLVKRETINTIANDFINNERRNYIINQDFVVRCLLGENCRGHVNQLDLLQFIVNDKTSYKEFQQRVAAILKHHGYDIDALEDIRQKDNEQRKLFNILLQKERFTQLEIEYVATQIITEPPEKFVCNVINVAQQEFKINKPLTLYYNSKRCLIGYDVKQSDCDKEITTTHYIKLVTYPATVSFKSTYFTLDKENEMFLADFLRIGIEIVPTQYLIVPSLNWSVF